MGEGWGLGGVGGWGMRLFETACQKNSQYLLPLLSVKGGGGGGGGDDDESSSPLLRGQTTVNK